ncbi:MAG: metallophosphoesterase [Bacillota bacterium]|nr:metallophosphoesterase [Bacillota bacterium]
MTLYPIADVHYGAQECMEKEFRAYIKAIEQDNHAAVILAGDLINNGIKSSVTNCYDETCTPKQQKYDMVDFLMPIKDKIICGARGNHEYRVTKESSFDIMEDIFRELGIVQCYAKDMGFLKISLGEKPNKKQATYMFAVAHGNGGGQLLGSGLNKPDAMQITIEGIDGIISGHTHKPAKVPSGRLIFDSHNNNIIRGKTMIFVCTSWLDYGDYPERMLLRPTAFNPDTIRLDGKTKQWS